MARPEFCSVQREGCLLDVAYELLDPGMAAPAVYCYACLPAHLRDRAMAGQLTVKSSPAPVGALQAVAPAAISELPPAVVAGTGQRVMGLQRRPQLKPDYPGAPSRPVPPDKRPTVVTDDPRITPVVRPTPPTPPGPTPPTPPAPR